MSFEYTNLQGKRICFKVNFHNRVKKMFNSSRLKISREENWNRDEREEEEGLMKEKKEKRG